MKRLYIAIFLVSLTIASCDRGKFLESIIPSTPTITLTPTFTPTFTPTNTLTPTATFTPTPYGGGSGKIAFESGFSSGGITIKVMNTDGANLFTLGSVTEWAANPVWSSDGSKLFYLSLFPFPHSSYPTTSLHRINADGSNIEQITTSGNVRNFAFSPDEKKIVFSIGGFDDIQSEIFIADFDGSSILRPVKLHNGYGATWSPDGTKILFSDDIAGNGYGHICVINVDGSNLIDLTAISNKTNIDYDPSYSPDGNPSWSPDGSKIVFYSRRENHAFKIFVMNSDGSNVLKLNEDGIHPSFSPDGKKIIFTSSHESEIYAMNADGTDIIQLVNCGGLFECQDPVWAPMRQ
jgi:Tol biopolymer transport system component